MHRRRRSASPWRDLAHLAWQIPLIAVPFALFFVLVTGAPIARSWSYYFVSLVFSAYTNVGVWITKHALIPRLVAWRPDDRRLTLYISILFMFVSLLMVMAAALSLHLTILPGFLGGARSVLMVVVYCLLFGALFLGISLAISFHRESMQRAGSERELQLARRIQRSFLLSEFPGRARLDVHAVNRSSKEVSGDFYDVVPTGDEGLLIAVADVSGKGVPAALLSSMIQASLRTQAGEVSSTAAMLATVNRLACQRDSTGQFATLFLAHVHEPTLTLRFTNAGHNFPVLVRADGSRELLETGGLLAGMIEHAPYEEGTVALRDGDRLVVYTDGVTEAENAAGQMYGEERLYARLAALPPSRTARECVDDVLSDVLAFLGEVEAGDDITVLALRVHGDGAADPRS